MSPQDVIYPHRQSYPIGLARIETLLLQREVAGHRRGSRIARRSATTARHWGGYCAAHRDQLPARFTGEAEAKDEVVWTSDEPMPLRPHEVAAWFAVVDRGITEAGIAVGVLPADAYIPVASPEDVPEDCPRCGRSLSWGTGPHLTDAVARGNAMAWQCQDCHAAGLLA